LTAGGGSGTGYAFTTSSNLDGLTLTPGGLLSGTPTAAGYFPITVFVTDTFGDTDSQTYILNVALGTSANAVYVGNLYSLLLGRAADPSGSYWVGLLDEGASPGSVIVAIENTPEYLGIGVTGIYRQYLSRTPDSGGLSYWVSQLQGGETIEQVIQGFISSPEFFQAQGHGANSGLVTAFYQDVLNRAPDPTGSNFWVNALNTGAVSPAGMAWGFLTSQEYRNNLVDSYYQEFLLRNAGAGGLAYWTGRMAAGITDQQVLAAILGAPEPYADWS
jgi:hypothetical protein